MITKCPYCSFCRERELSEAILNVIAEPDLPTEDFMLWGERLVQENGFKEYRGVQVHIGRMHKGQPIEPAYEYSEKERAIFERARLAP